MGKLTVVITLLLAIALTGCGGGGGGSAAPSLFAGHWIGTWTGSSGDDGAADLVIATTGAVIGTTHSNTDGSDMTVAGTIANTGVATMTLTQVGVGSADLAGTLTIQGNGHLAGAVQTSVNGIVTGSCTFDLVRQ